MALEKYKRKRDFTKTPEPLAKIVLENGSRFVVQRHQARRLHYDLRLEMEGVLKSWAVPKGPSMNPKDKRLAVETEDHPVRYLHFQGDIPKGNYGAGHMDIWDEGMYAIEGKGVASRVYLKGKMKLIFHGKKLRGAFTLVRSTTTDHPDHWLLIKTRDRYATDLDYSAERYARPVSTEKIGEVGEKAAEVQTSISPMLASSGKQVFNDSQWIYELKYDGYRALASVREGQVELYSRNGISFNSKFPSIYDELGTLTNNVLLDGEVVVLSSKGIPQFQELQHYDPETTKGRLHYYVFDLLHLNGHNTMQLPLVDRKSLLPELLEGLDAISYSDHVEGMGKALYDRATTLGMEGIIAKRANSTYMSGYRTKDWLKLKKSNSQEAVICGYTLSDKNRPFGSLILGMMVEGQLKYVGNCGTGFSSQDLKELFQLFQPLVTKKLPFVKEPDLKGRTPVWLDPFYVCEVIFAEWTREKHLRYPVYKGLREDKVLSEVKREMAPDSETFASTVPGTSLEIGGIQVPISNPDKVLWPEDGFTKYDLLDYYIQVSNWILPYLRDRPENLHRHPNGIDRPGFYQRDNEHLPSWVESLSIPSKSAGKEIEYLLCQNEATLLYMANLGCIELNPWHVTVHDLNRPTYAIIDLDPSPKNTFQEVVETALVAKGILDRAKIPGYCKTSGSKGLHIYIPLYHVHSYAESLTFTKLLCYHIAGQLPKLTTMERALKKRGNKIYLDHLQNRKGQTIAAPYSVRPRKGATVSTPLHWEELEKELRMSDFNIHTVPGRLAREGDIFKNVLRERIDMEAALRHLEEGSQ